MTLAMLESGRKGPLDLLDTTARRENEAYPAFRALTVPPGFPDSREKREQRAHQDHGAATANPAPGDSQERRVSKDTRAHQAERARLEISVHLAGTDLPESQDTLGLKESKESGA